MLARFKLYNSVKFKGTAVFCFELAEAAVFCDSNRVNFSFYQIKLNTRKRRWLVGGVLGL